MITNFSAEGMLKQVAVLHPLQFAYYADISLFLFKFISL
jgi:hypothetical protein